MEAANNDNLNIIFGFSFPVITEGLANSIMSFGQMTPIVTSSISGKKAIINGYRRFSILSRNNIDPVFFEIPEVSLERAFIVYLVENSSIRRFNIVEKVRICRFIVQNEIAVPNSMLNSAQLGNIQKNSDLYEFIESIEENKRLTLVKRDTTTNLIEKLQRMGTSLSNRIIEIIEKNNLTHQQTREFIESIYLGFMREMDLDRIISDIYNLSFDETKRYLKSSMNPIISRMESDFYSFSSGFKNIELQPPQNFEGDYYRIFCRFRTEEDLVGISRELTDLIKKWKTNPILK